MIGTDVNKALLNNDLKSTKTHQFKREKLKILFKLDLIFQEIHRKKYITK